MSAIQQFITFLKVVHLSLSYFFINSVGSLGKGGATEHVKDTAVIETIINLWSSYCSKCYGSQYPTPVIITTRYCERTPVKRVMLLPYVLAVLEHCLKIDNNKIK